MSEQEDQVEEKQWEMLAVSLTREKFKFLFWMALETENKPNLIIIGTINNRIY